MVSNQFVHPMIFHSDDKSETFTTAPSKNRGPSIKTFITTGTKGNSTVVSIPRTYSQLLRSPFSEKLMPSNSK